MCGIAGYIGNSPPSTEHILRTLKLMRNRGPDDQQYSVIDNSIALLFARLAILDLDPRSNQPFSDGDYTVIFNGELYNYVELRADLERQGMKFTTTSDTEVLLKSFIYYGSECVKYFEGMWAFAIYNRRDKNLFLSRDRFGEKPLFIYKTSNEFFFASEVKFIKSLANRDFLVNQNKIEDYLIKGYRSLYKDSETFFKDVHELPRASCMNIGPDLQVRSWTYWSSIPDLQQSMSAEDAAAGVKHHLKQALKIRLRADVPLAFCLSGGIDSSGLAALAAKEFSSKIHTFSIIDSDPRYFELANIKATIAELGCDHTLIELSQENFITRLTNLIDYHDSPLATISYYVHSYLSESISKAGYRVAISGTGADELLTGYYDHYLLQLYELRNTQFFDEALRSWKHHIEPLIRNPLLRNPYLYIEDPKFRSQNYQQQSIADELLLNTRVTTFTEELYSSSLLRNRMLNELFHESIPVILHEDDCNSMLFSVENRSPYLDSRLFDFCYSIPAHLLINDGFAKYPLRQALGGILNDQVRLDRKKVGFNASITSIVDLTSDEFQNWILSSSALFELVDRSKLQALLKHQLDGDLEGKLIFNLINLRIFLEQHSL